MSLSRREFLRLSGLVAAGATLAACSPAYRLLEGSTPPDLSGLTIPGDPFFALRRLTYGPRLDERQLVANIGLGPWIEDQLSTDSQGAAQANWRLRTLDSLQLDADALAGWKERDVILELQRAAILQRIFSPHQLYEMMVEFWTDHFNISVEKGDCWFLKTVDDREVIRPNALGNFRDLLWASAHSPAMLVYLDNQANHKEAPNENYARELLELHTLGVDGGYTQNDVMALARCLTGWSVKEHFWLGEFVFQQEWHTLGPKTVLGKRIAPGGAGEAESVLETLATHPATAHFLARKLARRFLGDQPEDQGVAARAAQAFLNTRGEIGAMVRVILLDGVARRQGPLPAKYRRPVDFVTSSLRCLQAETDGDEPVLGYLSQMGQRPFEWPTPDGPPDRFEAWSGNLMPRWRFAVALGRNEIPGTRLPSEALLPSAAAAGPEELLTQLSQLLLGAPLESAAQAEILEALMHPARPAPGETELGSLMVSGLLASPAFQWR